MVQPRRQIDRRRSGERDRKDRARWVVAPAGAIGSQVNQMLRLIQLQNGNIRKIGIVDEPRVRLLSEFASIYELAQAAINGGVKLSALAKQHSTDESLDYDQIYGGQSEWRILPAADHPEEPARCLVSGTGLTHMASARNRDAMHAKGPDKPEAVETLTDSMK